jgi:DNA mismatch endonuclease, patch repair protein
MVDRISREHRSWNMSRIRGRDTRPEQALRSYLHREGRRYRIHVSSLPGTPDIVFPNSRLAVFVHGCFWHRHRGCPFAYTPATNRAFWKAKFASNVLRDRRTFRALRKAGWTSIVIWECEIAQDIVEAARPISEALSSQNRNGRTKSVL